MKLPSEEQREIAAAQRTLAGAYLDTIEATKPKHSLVDIFAASLAADRSGDSRLPEAEAE